MIFNTPYEDNEIVGYYNEKLIVESESGNLYFCEAPKELFDFGETVNPNDLQKITVLSTEEQNQIKQYYGD